MRETSPIILVLPGGGYSSLAPHEGEPIAEWLRSIGWRARVVEYPVKTRHPAPLEFVQAVIAEERAAGTTTIGIIGFSAGGHLAGLTTLTPDAAPGLRPDFAILCYPVVSMLTATHAGSRENLIGLDASDELRRSVSLELLVTETTPPMFIWTTGEDASVAPVDHAYPLATALARAGVPHDFHVFERGGHGTGRAEDLPAAAWTELCELWLQYRL